jgi:hypothetical protein
MKKILFTFLLAISASSAQAATVFLKGGGSLEGAIVSSTAGQTVIDTSQGRVSVDAARIERIDYGNAAPSPAAPPPAPGGYQEPGHQAPGYPPPPYARRRMVFEPRKNSLSIDFGLAAPLSSIDFSGIGGGSANNGDLGGLIGVQYLYLIKPRTSLGLEFNYYDRSFTDSPGLVPNSFAHVTGDSVLLLGDLKYSLTDQGSVRPYLLLGAGAHYTSTTVDAHPNPGFVWSDTLTSEGRRLVDGSVWGPAISVRLGLDLLFADPSVFGFEAGWTGLLNADYQPTAQGRALGLARTSETINFFTFAGRWGWNF